MAKTSLSMLLTTLCLTLSPLSTAMAAEMTCNKVFEAVPVKNAFPARPQWRKTEGNLFSAVRANAPHNWAYFKKIKPRLVHLKEVFEAEGVGIGDFHILNIGDIELANGTRKIGLIDVDDGGRTSLFADFARSAISNQVSPYKVPLRDLWNNYLDGLKYEKIKKPKVIEDVLAKSHDDYLAEQKKYLTKMIDGNKFSPAAAVRPITECDAIARDIYVESIGAMSLAMPGAKILDYGFKVKETGGSQGVPRFWFLIEKKGEKTIIEFKTLADPAMSLYEPQASQADRINSLIEFYRPQKSTFGFYKFIDSGKYQFLARERTRGLLSLDPEAASTPSETRDGQDVYLYLAQRAGKWHSQQGQGPKLYDLLTDKEDQKFHEFETLVNDYIELMRRENQ